MTPTVVPRTLASHFYVTPGSRAADFGAGSGHFLVPLAEKVGRTGTLMLCEVQRPLVDTLDRLARQAGYSHVNVAWCDIEIVGGTPINDADLDTGFLINTLYQCADKESVVTEIARTVRSGGVVYVVDWLDGFSGLGPQAEDVVARDAVIALFEQAYFVFEREYPAGVYHYGLAFRKL